MSVLGENIRVWAEWVDSSRPERDASEMDWFHLSEPAAKVADAMVAWNKGDHTLATTCLFSVAFSSLVALSRIFGHSPEVDTGELLFSFLVGEADDSSMVETEMSARTATLDRDEVFGQVVWSACRIVASFGECRGFDPLGISGPSRRDLVPQLLEVAALSMTAAAFWATPFGVVSDFTEYATDRVRLHGLVLG